MKPMKYRLILVFLSAFLIWGAVYAQDEGTQIGETWWGNPAMWEELDLEFLPRANWCDGLNVAEVGYEAAFAAGQTDAESLPEWCLQIKTAFYMKALASCQGCLAGEGEEQASLICECVCAHYPGEECQQCQEDSSNPALLRLPNICECIVRQ